MTRKSNRDNVVSGKYRKKIKKSRKEAEEYGPGKKDVAMCESCTAVYYYKSWHHRLRDYKHLNEDKEVNFTTCPACKMIKDGKFEGKVVFENVPESYTGGIMRNITNTGERAYKRDPMDRIINIKSEIRNPKSATYNVQVLTTENQLARNIARQVERAYKNLKADINWSKDESTVSITVNFKE